MMHECVHSTAATCMLIITTTIINATIPYRTILTYLDRAHPQLAIIITTNAPLLPPLPVAFQKHMLLLLMPPHILLLSLAQLLLPLLSRSVSLLFWFNLSSSTTLSLALLLLLFSSPLHTHVHIRTHTRLLLRGCNEGAQQDKATISNHPLLTIHMCKIRFSIFKVRRNHYWDFEFWHHC